MARYIDADKIYERIAEREWMVGRMNSINRIDYQFGFTAEYARAKAEVRRGKWVKDNSGAEFCSECNQYPYDDGEYHITNWHSYYCPNCGAKMNEEK